MVTVALAIGRGNIGLGLCHLSSPVIGLFAGFGAESLSAIAAGGHSLAAMLAVGVWSFFALFSSAEWFIGFIGYRPS